MKAVVAAFNQEKALVGAFSVITNIRMQFGCNFLRHYRERRNLSLPPDIGPGHVPDILLDTHVSGTGHTCGAQHSV